MLPVAHRRTLPLSHSGDCGLIGIASDGTIYADEVYGENGWVAQHALRPDGTLVQSIDEQAGAAGDIEPLDLPPEIVKPRSGWQTMALNFAGPRHRGLREPERTLDLVQPLGIQEKMALVDRLKLDILPPLLLGIAESYVLAETEIVRPNLYFVCRRLRIAVALPETRLDEAGQPYDYDTLAIYLAHFYDRSEELRFLDCFGDLTSVPLQRPMDCLRVGNLLYIADGGEADRLSAIHVWQIDLPEALSADEKLRRKIYG